MSKTVQHRPIAVSRVQSYRDFMRSLSIIDTRRRERDRLAMIEARAEIARRVGA